MGSGTGFLPHHKSQSYDYGRRQDENRPARPASSGGEHSSAGMKRERSVRFVGSRAEGQKPLAPKVTQTTVYNLQKKPSTGYLRPRTAAVGGALTNDSAVPAVYRPPSRTSSLGRVPDCPPENTANYPAALAAYDENYLREDDLPSDPSSYRKIRRSKSLLHNNGTGVAFYSDTLEGSRPTSTASGLGGVRTSGPQGPRAMKSMSFLHPPRARTSTGTDGYDVDVQIARDEFLKEVEQQRLASEPSFLFRRKSRSEDNKMRRSMRRPSSETNSYGMPIASTGAVLVTATHSASMRSKARKASKKWGNKIRGLFKRGSSEEHTLPQQQVESHRSHMSDYQVQIGPPSSIHDEFQDVLHPADDPNLSRVETRLPSLHNVASDQQLRSLAGSMQSMRSDASTHSRLTSWGTTATDTTQAQQERSAAAERARQRLSIINENGTHKASSSFNRNPVKNQFSPYPSFHYPSSIGTSALSPVQSAQPFSPQGQITAPVDSARVYSALMKRLDETSPQAKLRERASKASLASQASLAEPPSIGPRCSSLAVAPILEGTPATIKSVPHENEPPLPVRESPSHHDLCEFGPPPPAIGNDDGSVGYKTVQYQLRSRSSSNITTVITQTKVERYQVNYRAFPPPVMGDMPTDSSLTPRQLVRLSLTPKDMMNLTPQQIANALEPSSSGSKDKGLRETKSTFFGSRDIQNIGRVASPYRRAVAEADLRDSLILLGSEDYAASIETLPLSPELRASRQWPMTQTISHVELDATKGSMETSSKDSRESSPELSTPYKSKVKTTPGSKETVETGSIYSRATTDDSPPRPSIDEVAHVEEAQDEVEEDSTYVPGKHGSMILLEHSTYPSRVSKSHHRSSSSGTSVDWKAWMKGEVENLGSKGRHSMERTTSMVLGVLPKVKRSSVASRLSDSTIRQTTRTDDTNSGAGGSGSLERTKSGHVREDAQIHGDDTAVGPGAGRARRGFYHKPQNQPVGVAQNQLLAQQRSTVPKPVLKNKGSVGSFKLDLHSFPPPPNQLPPPPPEAPLPLYFGKDEGRGGRSLSVAGSAAKKSLTADRPVTKTPVSKGGDTMVTPKNTPQPLSERAVSSSKANVRHGRSASTQILPQSGSGPKKGLGKKTSAQSIRPLDWELGPGFPQVQPHGSSPSVTTAGKDTPPVTKLTRRSENHGRRTSVVGSLRSMSRTYTPSPGTNVTVGADTGIRKMVQDTWGSAGRRIESGRVPTREVSMNKPVEFDGLSPMMGQGLAQRVNENWVPGRGERYGDGSVGNGRQPEMKAESKMGTGTRKMVDLFLSSRRKATKSSDDGAFV